MCLAQPEVAELPLDACLQRIAHDAAGLEVFMPSLHLIRRRRMRAAALERELDARCCTRRSRSRRGDGCCARSRRRDGCSSRPRALARKEGEQGANGREAAGVVDAGNVMLGGGHGQLAAEGGTATDAGSCSLSERCQPMDGVSRSPLCVTLLGFPVFGATITHDLHTCDPCADIFVHEVRSGRKSCP